MADLVKDSAIFEWDSAKKFALDSALDSAIFVLDSAKKFALDSALDSAKMAKFFL